MVGSVLDATCLYHLLLKGTTSKRFPHRLCAHGGVYQTAYTVTIHLSVICSVIFTFLDNLLACKPHFTSLLIWEHFCLSALLCSFLFALHLSVPSSPTTLWVCYC